MLSRSRVLRAIAIALLILAAWATAASAATAARARSGKYKGTTSQLQENNPSKHIGVTLTVNKRGTRVNFAIPYAKETDCTGNSTYVAGNTDLGKNEIGRASCRERGEDSEAG